MQYPKVYGAATVTEIGSCDAGANVLTYTVFPEPIVLQADEYLEIDRFGDPVVKRIAKPAHNPKRDTKRKAKRKDWK